MSLAIPDLGALDAQIDALLQDADLETEDAAPDAATQPVEPPGDEEVGTLASPEPEAPAADAEDDFETRYQERARSDIRKLQSKLDRQISSLKAEKEDLSGQASEAEHAVGYLLKQLREYDPEAADRFEQGRKNAQTQLQRDRKLERLERQQHEDTRAGWYAAAFPNGEIAHDDPELLEALALGKDAEKRLLKIKVREAGLTFDEKTSRFVKAGAQAAPPVKAQAQMKPEDPRPEPVRNEKGQFVSAQVAATREREAARGTQPALLKTGAGGKPPTNTTEGAIALKRGLAALGLG